MASSPHLDAIFNTTSNSSKQLNNYQIFDETQCSSVSANFGYASLLRVCSRNTIFLPAYSLRLVSSLSKTCVTAATTDAFAPVAKSKLQPTELTSHVIYGCQENLIATFSAFECYNPAMSFFGFDATLPRDRGHNTSAPGFAQASDPFARPSQDDEDDDA